MIVDPGTSGTRKIKDPGVSGTRKLSDLNLQYDFNPTPAATNRVITGGGTSTFSQKDATIFQTNAASVLQWNNIAAHFTLNLYSRTLTFTSSNPNMPIDQNGIITPVGNSIQSTTVTVIALGLGSKSTVVTTSIASTVQTQAFQGFVSGSLGAHLVSQVNLLISGRPNPGLGSSPPYFSTATALFSSGTTRNSSLFCSFDFSCIPLYNNGALVTPRDLVMCSHNTFIPGWQMTFADYSGNTYTRTILQVGTPNNLTYVGSDWGDISVITFDSDLPAGVKPATVLTGNVSARNSPNLLPQLQYRYPILWINQDHQLLIMDLFSWGAYNNGSNNGISSNPDSTTEPWSPTGWPEPLPSLDSTRVHWGVNVRGNDSSSAMFMAINGHPYLFGIMGSPGCDFVNHWTDIEGTIAANWAWCKAQGKPGNWDNPYTITRFDPTTASFPTYTMP